MSTGENEFSKALRFVREMSVGENEIAGILLFVALLVFLKVMLIANDADFGNGRPKTVKKVILMEAFQGCGREDGLAGFFKHLNLGKYRRLYRTLFCQN